MIEISSKMGKEEDVEAVKKANEAREEETKKQNGRTRPPSFRKSSRMNSHEFETVRPDQRVLTPDEKVSLSSYLETSIKYV